MKIEKFPNQVNSNIFCQLAETLSSDLEEGQYKELKNANLVLCVHVVELVREASLFLK